MGSPPQRSVGKRGEDGGEGRKKRRRKSRALCSMRWGWGCCVCWWSRCFPGWWGWSHPSSPSPSPSPPPSALPSAPPSPWGDEPPQCLRRPWGRSGLSGAPGGRGPTLDVIGKRSSTADKRKGKRKHHWEKPQYKGKMTAPKIKFQNKAAFTDWHSNCFQSFITLRIMSLLLAV